MIRNIIGLGIPAAIVFFIAGILVGQRTHSKFEKYIQPSVPSAMDIITLEANVDEIRQSIAMEPGEGITIPEVFYDLKSEKFKASAFILPDFEKASLEDIKARITTRYYGMYESLKSFVPELLPEDFSLRVVRFTADPSQKLFAEFKNGTVILH